MAHQELDLEEQTLPYTRLRGTYIYIPSCKVFTEMGLENGP